MLAADLWTGTRAREEFGELEQFLADHDGPAAARETVSTHLRSATAVVGMQILMFFYDDSVAAANAVIAFLESRAHVLTQVDTVGWYDASGELLTLPD